MRIRKPIVAGVSILAAIGFSIEAFRLAGADVIVAESNAAISSHAWARAAPSIDAWLKIRNELLRAERLAPNSPSVSESLGVLHATRAGSRELLVYSRDYFLRALEARPTSPYTWANYAAVKYLLGETGPAFETALVNAVLFGPWEPRVQRIVADVGLAVYGEVKPPARAAIAANVHSGMLRNPLEILQISEKRGRLDIACRHVAGNKRMTDAYWLERCKRERAP
jgi:hypothetical protein